MRAALVACLAVLAGCPIEPPEAPPSPRDASVRPDATVTPRDAGPSSCDAFTPCAPGLACSGEGVCVAPGARCARAEQCGGLELCAGGVCQLPEGRCLADDACGGGRCLPSGWCAPFARLVDDALVARCSSRAECGVLGVCRLGICNSCRNDVDCGGPYVCGFDGLCREPFECSGRTDCAPGNVCDDGACVPASVGCVADPGNDLASGASALTGGSTLSASICGDDVDHWSFELDANEGARVVARTDVRRNEVRLSLNLGGRVTALELPGLSVIEVASSTAARTLIVGVHPLNAGGRYALSVEPLACAQDLLDVYGDDRPQESWPIDPEGSVERHVCPRDVDVMKLTAGAGDRFTVSSELGGPGAVETRVRSSAGASLASVRAASTVPVTLTPPAPASDDLWSVELAADNVPAEGTPARVDLARIRGGRVEACGATLTDLSGATRVALSRDLGGPACDPSAPRAAFDRVLRVPAAAPGTLLRLTARPTSTTSLVSLAAIARCEDDASALACDTSPSRGVVASLELVLGREPVFVVVSSTAAGEVELSAALDERGDYSCRLNGATPIVASGELSVDTRGATNTVESFGACGLGPGDGAGPDRFFALSLGAAERAVLDLEGPSGGLLWVGTSCEGMSSSCAAAATSRPGEPARVVLQPDRATNYLVAVDGVASDDAGSFILRSRLRPECVIDGECPTMGDRCDDLTCRPPPANDRCDGELVTLTSGSATLRGSTGAANDDFASRSCAAPNATADVVYAVDVPPGSAELRARITRASWDPVLSVRFGTCGTATAEVACNDDADALTTLLSDVRVPSPAPGRYYVIVDGYFGGGPFELELTAR